MENLNPNTPSVQIFSNAQFGQIRTIVINEKPYFVGIDVAISLGYKEPHKAIARHCKGWAFHPVPDNQGFTQETKIIPQGDVYRLAAKSKLPSAEAFESWIFDEVLVSISKSGGYMIDRSDDTPEMIMARALQIAQDTIERSKQKVQMLEGENELLLSEIRQQAPKVQYVDNVLQSTRTYTSTQMAKELGLNSAYSLEKKLSEMNVMFKQSGQWMLTARYCGKGYTKTRTHSYEHSDGTKGSNTITVWTESGREFLHQLLKASKTA